MKHRVGRARLNQRGLSLVEVLIALGLGTLVLSLIVTFFANLTRSSTAQNAAAAAQQATRTAIDYVAGELRAAGLDPLKTAGAGIEEISPTGDKLRFTTDRCDLPISSSGKCDHPVPDGDVEDMTERVTFFHDAAARTLRRCFYDAVGNNVSCEPIVAGVVPNPDGSPLFRFLDQDENPVTSNDQRGAVRTVIVTLTVEEPAGRDKTATRTYSARVRMRNIGL
jgi:type II secretory pathway pseudopilin PulG